MDKNKNFFNDDKRLEVVFGIRYGEKPCTRFVDNLDAVEVKLINWPDPERAQKHLINFAAGSWFEDFSTIADLDDYQAALNELMEGKILAQGLEGLTFSFLVKGLSLHGSHAIVRTRIGAAYLQQSQAVTDFRHADILVPRAFQKTPLELEEYKYWVIRGKRAYADMLDSGKVSVTDARFCLPKTIPVWVNISMTLPTILSVYSKRTDRTEEHPEMNIFAELLREEIVKIFPYMDSYFKRDANCIHRFPGYRSNCVFKRDGDDRLLDGVEDNWRLHEKTKYELMIKDLKSFETEWYIDDMPSTQINYERVLDSYYQHRKNQIEKNGQK